MEQLNDNLLQIEQFNHKLISKHGHHDLDKLNSHGIYNYSDLLDVQSAKRLRAYRRNKSKQPTNPFTLDNPSAKFSDLIKQRQSKISKRRNLAHYEYIMDEFRPDYQEVNIDFSIIPQYNNFSVQIGPNETFAENEHPNIQPKRPISIVNYEMNITKAAQ